MINAIGGIVTPDIAPPARSTDAELPDRPRVKDVAKWLGVHVGTVYIWIHRNEIPFKRVGKRTYIFEKATLLEWAKPEQEVV